MADAMPTSDREHLAALFRAIRAVVRRIPRGRTYAEEPAHSFRPDRFAGG